MEAANWQSYVAMGDQEAGAADMQAALVALDDAHCEGDFDLGDPWGTEFDPTDDDPE